MIHKHIDVEIHKRIVEIHKRIVEIHKRIVEIHKYIVDIRVLQDQEFLLAPLVTLQF